MGTIYIMNPDTDEELEIEHKNVKDLKGGFYIVKDFKEVKANEKAIRAALAKGLTVHELNAYVGNREPPDALFFTGKVVWKNEKFYDCALGGGLPIGKVPVGTLVVGLTDD